MKPLHWIIIAALAGVLLWYYGVEAILGILGLGGAAVLAKQKRADKAKTIADEHEQMAGKHLVDSVNEMNEAKASHKEAVEIAEDVTNPNYDLPPGFKPRNSRSR